jgi:hypothetical protein
MKKLFTFASLMFLVGLPALSAQNVAHAKPSAPPPYCNPCLFYGGDLGNGENGFVNADTIFVPFTEILVPFDVPAGEVWKVGALFTNNLPTTTGNVFDPKKAMWSIRQGAQPGDCGTLLASGDSAATIDPTGNTIFGYTEYNVLVKIPPIELSSGSYWLSVVPECLDSSCAVNVYYFISGFQGAGTGGYGPPEPNNESFSSSSLTGTNCGSVSGLEFSAGVLGASDTPYRGQ